MTDSNEVGGHEQSCEAYPGMALSLESGKLENGLTWYRMVSMAREQWTLEAESRVRGGNVTVLPGSRLVAQTMRLRVPACVGRNSCPYTLAIVLRLSCP